MNIHIWAPRLALALLCSTDVPATAADIGATDDTAFGNVNVWGGIGIAYLKANEYVYEGAGSSDVGSRLIWQSTAPVLTGGFDVALPEGWTVAGKAQFAFSGDSYMEDYDWFGPDFVSYDADEWTHRSQHEDTNLDWYVNASLLIGRDFALDDNVKVNLNGGFKYTDVQWTAYGGTYVYSDGEIDEDGDHFRDYVGSFTDGEPAITYRQSFPALVAGLDLQFAHDAWTFDVAGHAGFAISPSALDDHWMRGLQITDTLRATPLVSVDAQATYAVAESMSLVLAGSVEQTFTARGDGYYDNTPPEIDFTHVDGKGADLFAASLSAGLKGTF